MYCMNFDVRLLCDQQKIVLLRTFCETNCQLGRGGKKPSKRERREEKRLGNNDELTGHFLSLEVHRKRKNRKACPWGLLPAYGYYSAAPKAFVRVCTLKCTRDGSSKLPNAKVHHQPVITNHLSNPLTFSLQDGLVGERERERRATLLSSGGGGGEGGVMCHPRTYTPHLQQEQYLTTRSLTCML